MDHIVAYMDYNCMAHGTLLLLLKINIYLKFRFLCLILFLFFPQLYIVIVMNNEDVKF